MGDAINRVRRDQSRLYKVGRFGETWTFTINVFACRDADSSRLGKQTNPITVDLSCLGKQTNPITVDLSRLGKTNIPITVDLSRLGKKLRGRLLSRSKYDRKPVKTFFHQNACGMKKCLYFCSTRTRQASQRCSNVRVVLFLYLWQIGFHFRNPIPIPATSSVCYNRADLSPLIQPKQNATLNTSAITACQPICILCFKCPRNCTSTNKELHSVK